MRYPFDPDWVVPTSEVLAEWLNDHSISPRVAAARLPHEDRADAVVALTGVLNDDPVTYDTALLMDRITGIPTRFWLAFEHNYREGLAAGKSVVR